MTAVRNSGRLSGRNGKPTGAGTVSEALEETLREYKHELKEDWTVPASIFTDPEVYRVEQERIFGRTWQFLAHVSEISNAGDYVVRYILDDQFIVIRDEDGEVRAHLNSCRHRGTQLCRAEMGNTSHFRCPYHGWTYSNKGKLVGVPAAREAYGNNLDKNDLGLRPIPQLAVYKGFIFGCTDPDMTPLEDYLGDFKFYLDLIFDRTDGGVEVRGAPFRWMVNGNWKLITENFGGDAYHTLYTHRSVIELGLIASDPKFALYGAAIQTDHGHGIGIITSTPGASVPPFQGIPSNLVEQARRRLTPEQLKVGEYAPFIHGMVFPNMAILDTMGTPDLVSPMTSAMSIRVLQPVGPDQTQVWSYFLVEKDAPEEYKNSSYEMYAHHFGPAGVIEQDDGEIFSSATRAMSGQMARKQHLNYRMGRDHVEEDPNWPGPGRATPTDYAEANQRNMLSYWVELMTTSTNGKTASQFPASSDSSTTAHSGK